MNKSDKLTGLLQKAASAVTMATPTDLSDISELQNLLDDITNCVQEMSKLPDQLKQDSNDAATVAAGMTEKLLTNQAENVDDSLKDISDVISAFQKLSDQIEKGISLENVAVDFPELLTGSGTSQDTSDTQNQPAESTPTAAATQPAADDQQTTVIDDDDIELIADFLAEAAEHIESAESGLLEIESKPGDAEAINLIFRGFHTIKGMAGFLNLTDIGLLAHAAENLLDLARKGNIQLAGTIMEITFESIDTLKSMMAVLQTAIAGSKTLTTDPSLAPLLTRLKAAAAGTETPAAATQDTRPAETTTQSTQTTDSQASVPAVQNTLEPTPAAEQTPAAAANVQKTKHAIADEKIKVSTTRLDSLVNMVGELVIAQSMVGQEATSALPPDHDLCRHVGHQGKIVRELQELSMMMRLVPMQGVFQKMTRLVRDLCQKSGKKINFVTSGEDTELDRIVVDQISDPLVHMIRNSVDHAVEPEDERKRLGKDTNGRIDLRAFHQAGNVVIEIEDDGRGLNKEKILKKAIDNGLVTPDQELSDQEIYKLIFHPGLSTAAKVTEVSGRGVGMDVVRKNIESLRGKIEINSVPGKGSKFTIRLPLTMAIIDGQIVTVGDARYIIPIVAINSCLRPTEEQMSTILQNGEMAMVQNELIPVVRLHGLFDEKPQSEVPWEASMVVVEEDGKKACLMVDELLGQHQVVIKNLGEGIGAVKGVSGGAIMGDGKISLILDIPGLLDLATQ